VRLAELFQVLFQRPQPVDKQMTVLKHQPLTSVYGGVEQLKCQLQHKHIKVLLQPFNGLFSRTTWVSRYQKGKTNLDFTEARDSDWQWYQLGHMQVCTWLQTDNHASTPPLCFFTGRMPLLSPNQQRQSTEGINIYKGKA